MSRSELALAQTYLDANRPEDALKCLAPLIAAEPEDVQALCVLAQTQLALAHHADAWSSATKAVELDADNSWAWRLVSVAAASTRRFEESRHAAHIARDVDPESWQTHAQIVRADIWAGKITKATYAEAQIAIRLAPDNAEVFVLAGELQLANVKFKAAENAFRRALERDPLNDSALSQLAVVRFHRGYPSEAAVGILDLLADDPQSHRKARALRAAGGKIILRVVSILWIQFALVSTTAMTLLVYPTGSPQFGPAVRAPLVLELILGPIAIALLVLGVRRRLGPHFARFVRSIPSLSRGLAVSAALTAVAIIVVICYTGMLIVFPALPLWASAAIEWYALLLIACVVIVPLSLRSGA